MEKKIVESNFISDGGKNKIKVRYNAKNVSIWISMTYDGVSEIINAGASNFRATLYVNDVLNCGDIITGYFEIHLSDRMIEKYKYNESFIMRRRTNKISINDDTFKRNKKVRVEFICRDIKFLFNKKIDYILSK